MADTLLVTFGCSWTFGVGLNYRPGITHQEYTAGAWDADTSDRLSWRGLLCDQHGFDHVNFASGGSSNQRQQRLASQYFSSTRFQKHREQYARILVLWGLTSTARNELYLAQDQKLRNFLYADGSEISKALVTHAYHHDYEVWCLRLMMQHWDLFFSSQGVENFWFDSFNSHNYQVMPTWLENWPDRLKYQAVAGPDWPAYDDLCLGKVGDRGDILEEITDIFDCIDTRQNLKKLIAAQHPHRDLLSWLAQRQGIELPGTYHESNWEDSSTTIQQLVNLDLLNPISKHPTRRGHLELKEYFVHHLAGVF